MGSVGGKSALADVDPPIRAVSGPRNGSSTIQQLPIGADVWLGHSAEHVTGIRRVISDATTFTIILSIAVPQSGLQLIRRSQLLGTLLPKEVLEATVLTEGTATEPREDSRKAGSTLWQLSAPGLRVGGNVRYGKGRGVAKPAK